MTEADRAQRFREEVAGLRARTDASAVERRMLWAGWALMALGLLRTPPEERQDAD